MIVDLVAALGLPADLTGPQAAVVCTVIACGIWFAWQFLRKTLE